MTLLDEAKECVQRHIDAILHSPYHKRMDAYHAMVASFNALSKSDKAEAKAYLQKELERRVVNVK